MAETVIRLWGESKVEFRGLVREGDRMLHEYGVNYIRPKAIIELHIHNDDSEDYIPLTEGLKILVLPENEARSIPFMDLWHRIKEAKPARVGEVVKCPKGYAHTLYNSMSEGHIGIFRYVKYYNN